MATLKYKREHVPAVRGLTKTTTIRRAGKVAEVGELLIHTDEHGRPILYCPCDSLHALAILSAHEWILDGEHIPLDRRDEIARRDGFQDGAACALAIRRIYGLPFLGQLIGWNPADCSPIAPEADRSARQAAATLSHVVGLLAVFTAVIWIGVAAACMSRLSDARIRSGQNTTRNTETP